MGGKINEFPVPVRGSPRGWDVPYGVLYSSDEKVAEGCMRDGTVERGKKQCGENGTQAPLPKSKTVGKREAVE